MTNINRRGFIKTLSVVGAMNSVSRSAAGATMNEENFIIENGFWKIIFNRRECTLNINTANGKFLSGSRFRINTANAQHDISKENSKGKVNSFKDSFGDGKQLVVSLLVAAMEIDIVLSLYEQAEALSVEVICKNHGKKNIEIRSIEPLRAIKEEGGALHLLNVRKCLTNGEMYFDAGTLYDWDTLEEKPLDPKSFKSANGLLSKDSAVSSWWNICFFSGYDNEGVVVGYLDNNKSLGNLLTQKAGNEIALVAESVYEPALLLKPNESVSSNKVIIHKAKNSYLALENYASAVGLLQNALVSKPIICGWCSWFYTLAEVSEKEVVVNTEFAARCLKPYGLEYIQVDEGYQRMHGDWEGNSRFPHGMKWLANKIKSYGFKAGIWISPYVISEPTEVFRNHPEWLLKKKDGSLKRIGTWGDENSESARNESPKRYGLDVTHPEAAKWLYDLVHVIVHDWGYDMIKIDFVAWSILAAERYYDSTKSSAEVYRLGMDIIRKAAGGQCHILECGPGATTVGLIDSMRIEADVFYGYGEEAWLTYFTHSACSASAAAKRYHFHKRTWINDADHICLHMLNHQQSEAAATIIALSGGTVFSGDRLIQLELYKLEILKKVMPSYGEAACPVDLFDSDMPSVFGLKIKKTFAEWMLVACFNKSLKDIVVKKFPLSRLWLESSKTYLVFDFWKQQFMGEITREINAEVHPGSVTLLAVHEKLGHPQFIGTDRHVLQGAIEVEQVSWDEKNNSLSGISTGALGTSYNVLIYIPRETNWAWNGKTLFYDFENYTLKFVDKHILQVHIHFDKRESVNWKISFDDLK